MSRKDKLLASARKNLAKRQIPKAIKDYERLVELDPKDVRLRQKLAELYFRSNRVEDAIEEYEAVAKFFAENDFQVKAIAIYKQIQRLDPENFQSYLKLAELNEKQGLVGNALSEYQNLVKFYETHGDVSQAITTLQKMRDLDPSNLNVRAKLVESCARNERQDEAVEEFQGICEHLQEKRAFDKILKLYEMFLPILPEVPAMQQGLATVLIEKGEVDKGIRLVQDLLKKAPSDLSLLTLMSEGYARQEDFKGARMTCQQLIKLEPKNLEFRKRYIKVSLDDEQWEAALLELEEWKDAFLQEEKLQDLKGFYETLRNQMPNDRRVLQTLDSIYALTGEGEKLLDIMQPEERSVASESFDTSAGVEDLGEEDFLDGFDGLAADDLETEDSGQGGEPLDLDGADFLDLEEDLDTDDLDFESVVEAGVDNFESPEEEDFFDLELELEPEEDLSPVADATPLEQELNEVNPPQEATPEVIELPAAEDDEVPLELDISDVEELPDVIELDLAPDYEEDEPSPAAPDIQGALEEASFFLEQKLFTEAEDVCQKVLEQVPDAAEIQAKLQEIRSFRASALAADTAPVVENAPAEPSDGMDFSDLVEEIENAPEPEAEPETEDEEGGNVRLQEKLDSTDIESHYNLGIAYREMGLVDDAITEFRKIKNDPARFVDCHTLLGQCLTEKGEREAAEKEYRAALEFTELSDGQRFNLHYEMGLLYEQMDRAMDALDSFQYVADFDPFFRDVKDKITRLRQQLGMEAGSVSNSKDRVSYL